MGNSNFLCMLIWTCVSAETDRTTQMKEVKDRILKDYDKYIRPVTADTNTTRVHTAFVPRQIVDLDEEKAIFSLDSYLYVHWVDSRLRWNLSDYDGYLQLPSSMVWVPDISVFNSHSLQVDPTHDVLLGFDNTGLIWWFPPLLTQTFCPVAVTTYPGDEVTCEILFGSWVHDGWEVDYQHAPEVYFSQLTNTNQKWELLPDKTSTVRHNMTYEDYPDLYTYIQVNITMRRRPVPAIEATRAPAILVMILTLSIYWLPPGSYTKILLAGFIFVALNLLLVYVAASTKGPLSVLFAVSFLQTTMYLVIITILLQVLIVIKIASLTGPSRPPLTILQFLTGPIGKYACLRSPMSADKISLDRVQLNEDSSTVESFKVRDEWKLFATAVDRALFVVMSVVMIAVHHL